MNPTNYRRLVLLTAALLLVAQMGLAQSSVGSPGYVKALANAAASRGLPLAVVPASSVGSGDTRPHLWVARPLDAPVNPFAMPSFCNTFVAAGVYVFCPNGIQTTYGVNQIVGGNGGLGMTIAIVDAFHYANAEADLNYFSTRMGLPLCTSGTGCFTQVSQTGGPPVAGGDTGWELETMLDLEYAHAMAPKAKLLLVEGTTNSFGNLFTALAYAAANADVVSNSYGALEFDGEQGGEAFIPTGKPILFSSGDDGAPTSYPCASALVTCVGGTSLTVNGSFARTSEIGWAGSGGGCSAFIGPQPWQARVGATTARCTPDIAADGDPNTGVAVYDSGNGGFFLVGGTSLSAPLMAGLIADINTARVSFGKSKLGFLNTSLYNAAFSNYPYFYFDVLTGNNGFPAGAGYDLVTGLGVPKGSAMGNRFFGLIYPPPAPPPANPTVR